MAGKISIGNQSGTPRYQAWIDPGWTIGLWSAAIVLFTINLGVLPLRDWDEGIVAQVAREIANAPFESLTWLHPRDTDGAPYLSKPPLIHWLIALCYRVWRVNEWTARLPGALLTATSVPLLYGIGREIFFQRSPAVFAALVYLTSLPVVRQGRLAMPDGAALCFFLAMMLCLLRSRRDLRWGLGVGLGFSCLCFTQGILGILLAAIALVFIAWDTPRLLGSGYLWAGFGLGCVPVALWNGAQIHWHGETFLTTYLFDQSLKRSADSAENNRRLITYYVWEILKNGVPWVVFLPVAFRYAWENRTLSWARLVLVWSGIYFAVISLMPTKLPWYVMPLYPAFALVVGAQLQRFWQPAFSLEPVIVKRVRVWVVLFLGLAIVAWAGAIYYTFWVRSHPDLQMVFATLALTLTVTAVLMARQDVQFIVVLIWGTFLTLLVLMMSNYWIWELQEAFPAKPVGTMIQESTAKGQTIYTSYPRFRPSLNFYSERSIVPVSSKTLLKHWREDDHPYLLLDPTSLKKLPQKEIQFLGMSEEWALVSRAPAVKTTPIVKRKKKLLSRPIADPTDRAAKR